MFARNAERVWLLAIALSLPLALASTSHAAALADVPDQYRAFFRHYVDNRSITERAPNAIGFTSADVGRSFALLAGVSRYPRISGRAGRLDPARADVEQLATYLIAREFFDEVVVLLDDDVTEANLSYFLQRYFPRRLQAAPKSRFLFGYSGHGTTRPDGRGFLLTSGATGFDDFLENGIQLGVVRAMLNAVVYAGHFVLVLVNACYASDLHGRTGFNLDIPYVPKLEGAHVITAGGSNEPAWADPALGQGSIFFQTLLNGVNGRADHLPQDGIVTEKEIETYLIGTITRFTDQQQNPYPSDLRSDRSRGGFFFLDQQRMVERNILEPWDPRSLWSFGAGSAMIRSWDKTFGGRDFNSAYALVTLPDGGFAVAGTKGLKVDGSAGDAWVLRLDADGRLLWDKTFGGFDLLNALRDNTFGGEEADSANALWDGVLGDDDDEADSAHALVRLPDGGFAVAGTTSFKGGGRDNAWVLRLDADGRLLWDKTFRRGFESANALVTLPDGGLAVAGGGNDAWALRLDADGRILWEKTFGGRDFDSANALVPLPDGGFVVAGTKGWKGWMADGSAGDAWVWRLDAAGRLLWDNTFGGKEADEANALVALPDGGLAVAGSTASKGAGSDDAWVLRLDADGRRLWDKTFGGMELDRANALVAPPDGGLAVAATKGIKAGRSST